MPEFDEASCRLISRTVRSYWRDKHAALATRNLGASGTTSEVVEARVTSLTLDGGYYPAEIVRWDATLLVPAYEVFAEVRLKVETGQTLALNGIYAVKAIAPEEDDTGFRLYKVLRGAESVATITLKEIDGTPSLTVHTVATDSTTGITVDNTGAPAGEGRVRLAPATTTQAGGVTTSAQTWKGSRTLVAATVDSDAVVSMDPDASTIAITDSSNSDTAQTFASLLLTVPFGSGPCDTGEVFHQRVRGSDGSALRGRISQSAGGQKGGWALEYDVALDKTRFLLEATGAVTTVCYAITNGAGTVTYEGGTASTGGLVFQGGLYISGTISVSAGSVGGLDEAIDDRVAALLVAGTGISLTYNDPAGTLTIAATGGTGTVTSVSVVTANGVSGTVANPTTTPAITLTLGAITPTSIVTSGDVTVGGNLIVSGDTVTVNTATLTVEDPLIKLASGNVTDVVDIGFYGLYQPAATPLYTGLFRDATDGKYRLFKSLEVEPTTTVNTGGTGYAQATLVCALESSSATITGGTINFTTIGNITPADGTFIGVTATSIVTCAELRNSGALTLSGVITPSQITSNQNDYAPTGYNTSCVWLLSTDASRTITGIVPRTVGTGCILYLINTGSFNIVLSNQDTGSSADNRFNFGAGNVTILPGQSFALWYVASGGTNRWRPLSSMPHFGTQAANVFLASPSGGTGLATFRAIVAADLPITEATAADMAAATSSTTFVSPRRRTKRIVLQDQKTAGTAGGTFTSGAWRTRDLNTEVTDEGGDCTLASNQITLVAGTYRLKASAPGYYCNGHQAKLYNVTDAADVTGGIGTSERSDNAAGNGVTTRSLVDVVFTITASKAFEIRHQCQTTKTTDGLGVQVSWGTNVYTEVTIERIA